MKIDAGAIIDHIRKYFTDEQYKIVLSKWAIDTMRQLLNGDIWDIGNSGYWGIITTLTQIDDFDSCTREDIESIYQALTGDRAQTYMFQIRMPQKYQDLITLDIRNKFLEYLQQGCLDAPAIREIELFSQQNYDAPQTIIELLRAQVANLISQNYRFHSNEKPGMIFENASIVFPENYQENEDVFLQRLFRFLDCFTGYRYVTVCTTFNKGVPTVTLVI